MSVSACLSYAIVVEEGPGGDNAQSTILCMMAGSVHDCRKMHCKS